MIRHNEQTGVGIFVAYPNRESVEHVLRRLRDDGFDMRDIAVIGRGFEGDRGAGRGRDDGRYRWGERGSVRRQASFCAFCIGTALVAHAWPGARVHSGFSRRGVAGGVEGAVIGAVIGGLGGALVGWESRPYACKGMRRTSARGDFLCSLALHSEGVEYTQSVLAPGARSSRGL